MTVACAATLALSTCVAQAQPSAVDVRSDAVAPKPGPAPPLVPPPPPAPAPDTTSGASPPVAASIPPPRVETAPQPETGAEHSAPPENPPPVDRYRFAFGTGAHLAFGSAPAIALGFQLSAEIVTLRWSLGVEGRYDLPAGGRTTQGADARTSLAGVSMLPCLRVQASFVCGVVLLSHVDASAARRGEAGVGDGFFFLGLGGRLAVHLSLPLDFALRIVGQVLMHPFPYELSTNGNVLMKSFSVSTTIGPAIVRAF